MTSKQIVGQFGADHRSLNAATLRSQVVRTQDAQAAQLFLGANAPDVITAATGTCSLQTSVTYVQGGASPVVTLPLPSTTLFGNELQNGMLKSFVLTTAGSATIQPALPVGTMDVTMVLPNQSVTYMWCGASVGWALWSAPGAGTTNLPLYISSTLFVNRYINVAAGARERFDLPYNSITTAMLDALVGDTIYVYPGNNLDADPYIESFTLTPGVSLAAQTPANNGRGILDFTLAKPVAIKGTITIGTAADLTSDISYISGFEISAIDTPGTICIEATAGSTALVVMSDCSLGSLDAPAISHDAAAGNFLLIMNHCTVESNDSATGDAVVAVFSSSPTGLFEFN
jgi:hypothetical protein